MLLNFSIPSITLGPLRTNHNCVQNSFVPVQITLMTDVTKSQINSWITFLHTTNTFYSACTRKRGQHNNRKGTDAKGPGIWMTSPPPSPPKGTYIHTLLHRYYIWKGRGGCEREESGREGVVLTLTIRIHQRSMFCFHKPKNGENLAFVKNNKQK